MKLQRYTGNEDVKKDILSTLAYFDIFEYPLKRREVILFLPNVYPDLQIENALEELLDASDIFKLDEFFCLHDNYALVQRRQKGNERAKGMMATAERVSSFISKFPYVRGVAISGSLSKNYADENSDIDLFIITAKNRLWITRSLLRLILKVIYPSEKQRLYCMNYFVDELALEIEEKNIYTATEIVTLIPMQGSRIFQDFFVANNWTRKNLPNNYMSISTTRVIRPGWYKWVIEKLLNNIIGNFIDTVLMKITAKRWRKMNEQKFLNKNGLAFSVLTDKHYAKHDPVTFQDKIVSLHNQKVFDILNRVNVRQAAVN